MTNPIQVPAGTLQQGTKRVRAYAAGYLVAGSPAPMLVWEHPHFPRYAFAPGEVVAGLVEAGPGPRSRVFGPCVQYDIEVGGTIQAGAVRYPQAPDPALRELTLLRWDAMDTWLEEDEVVHTHARSPYVRIDALPSSRHVQVVAGAVEIADSRRPVVLFETGLVSRFYLPRPDVRMDLLAPTTRSSACPYKGTARYWSVRVPGLTLEDAAWGYDAPLREAHAIAGMVAFWPDRHPALELYVDGERV